jgi:Xaa-Pro dipeptidase
MLEQISLLDRVPKEEIEKRIDGLRKLMAETGIKSAVILQNADKFYFTGTMQKTVVVIPLEEEPYVFVEKGLERAGLECPLPLIPIKSQREIKDILMRKGISLNGAGFELDVLPVAVFERLRKTFDVHVYDDISPLIRRLRTIKSAFELGQLRRTTEQVSHVFQKAREVIRVGLSEIELEGTLLAEGRRHGHQGFPRMRGFNQEIPTITITTGITSVIPVWADSPIGGTGLYAGLPQGPSINRIREGVPVLVDYAAAYNGYTTDETRAFVVGKLDEVFRKPYETGVAIINDALARIKPGVDAAEIYDRARTIANNAGLKDNFMGYGEGQVAFLGHGVGLELNELPVITGRRGTILQAGMVFALEPKFIIPGRGAAGVEVSLVVTESGVERFTDDPLELVFE